MFMSRLAQLVAIIAIVAAVLYGKSATKSVDTETLRLVAKDFWRVHADYYVFGVANIGTQMGIVKLSSGKFLLLGAVPITEKLKQEIDKLTDNGKNIEAVITTHPFHTGYTEGLWKLYPDAKFYGTPRHIETLPDIDWTDDVSKCEVRNKWAPEIQMRIPAGASFAHPKPELTNHFSSVFVYHSTSRTLFVDDTLMYFEAPKFPINILAPPGTLRFHISMKDDGLYHTPAAPLLFRDWMRKLVRDWDFDTLSTAHDGVLAQGARQKVTQLLDDSEKVFQDLSETHAKEGHDQDVDPRRMKIDECA
eukprot:TRINITY_DN5741_c0_g2_i1.p1 TRINITY_DN5741_c0_g2~~TRINITY_DN5741_c0_g2_i1.p1  ORF type:complete len:305 (+),score=51.29 TRINITY_DN5741_c0_g2_i1:24-938(+)